ncbi:MAG: hypothetical protein KKE37_09105 [Verrucomicrobia bacterium]|nr:hypothetical protein [Verrucomicrobiota bacterium]MBU4247126.1 hypothetical protein [Verrucomicrobiota bacterium]MBU4429493.1 hypothetical protein [Verrucomicrobiota bacterium]MCG2680593.1 hypothetical protein [Kiritimatiellia bacterium]
MVISDARDRAVMVGDGLQVFPVFPGDIQRAEDGLLIDPGMDGILSARV